MAIRNCLPNFANFLFFFALSVHRGIGGDDQNPLHGQQCEPELDSHQGQQRLYPMTIDEESKSNTFLYCDQNKRKYVVGACVDKAFFDSIERKCIVEAIYVEEVQNATVIPTLKIFDKDKRVKQIQLNDNGTMLKRIRELVSDEEMGIGTALKIQEHDGIPTKVGRKEEPKLGTSTNDVKVLINLRENNNKKNSSIGGKENWKKMEKWEPNGGQSSSAAENNENGDGAAAGGTVRNLVPCSDGSLPFGGNNGLPHRCLPDSGHSPFSPFACPFSYRCEFIQYSRNHQCCPQMALTGEAFGEGEGDGRVESTQDKQFGGDEELGGSGILDLSQVCPPNYFLRVNPNSGKPSLCSPGWSLKGGGCPPFSRCTYSRSLLQFICCQPIDLRKALREAMHPKPIGILPGQFGCVSNRQCAVHFPGANCRGWTCLCPADLSAHNGRCVINCPYGHFDRDGICTPNVPVGQQRFWVLSLKKK